MRRVVYRVQNDFRHMLKIIWEIYVNVTNNAIRYNLG